MLSEEVLALTKPFPPSSIAFKPNQAFATSILERQNPAEKDLSISNPSDHPLELFTR